MNNEMPTTPDPRPLLANVGIVLVDPQFPENVGSAARAAMNFGISRLLIVKDEIPDRERMLKLATHHAAPILDAMETHPDLASALAPFAFVVGTTARLGRHRRLQGEPKDMVDHLLPLFANNQVALVFGPEHRGLTNEDLALCNLVTAIPTTDFSSLNLAQAVAILCYELYSGLLKAGNHDRPPVAKLADSHELEGMYSQLETMLKTIGFLKTEDHAYWMWNIRQFLGRMGLRAKEARIIRAFCRQLEWYDKKKGTFISANGRL